VGCQDEGPDVPNYGEKAAMNKERLVLEIPKNFYINRKSCRIIVLKDIDKNLI
jgi:hypothetical protein